MAEAKPLVPVLVGPTAVGKTAVAVALGRHWPVTVISADSRQIYRGLDIGTAKPDATVLGSVPHVGIDLVNPGERYSAGRFARDAAGWIDNISDDRRPMVVGGTGFYVRALADGLFREPEMNPERRGNFRRWASQANGLAGWARRLDPEYSSGGRQRAARTVEVALLTGRSLSWWQRQAAEDGAMRPWYIRLTAPRAFLHQRIHDRVHQMLESGWVAEVERVLGSGTPADAPGLDGVGYREIVSHLEGRLSVADLPEAIATSTRRYAKRQETWFRHQLGPKPVATLDATAPADVLAARILQLWEDGGSG